MAENSETCILMLEITNSGGRQAPTAATLAFDFEEAPRRNGDTPLEKPPLFLFDQRLLHFFEAEILPTVMT